ncbi:hypothetical protein BH11ARM2_BH11ARM2_35790 [soil metagenome]
MADKSNTNKLPKAPAGLEIGNVLKPLESLKEAAKKRKSGVVTK